MEVEQSNLLLPQRLYHYWTRSISGTIQHLSYLTKRIANTKAKARLQQGWFWFHPNNNPPDFTTIHGPLDLEQDVLEIWPLDYQNAIDMVRRMEWLDEHAAPQRFRLGLRLYTRYEKLIRLGKADPMLLLNSG